MTRFRRKRITNSAPIFEPYNVRTDAVPGELDTTKDGFTRIYDADAKTGTFLFIRGNEMTPDNEPLQPAVPAFLGGKLDIHPIDLPATAWYPGLRPAFQHDLLAADDAAIQSAEQALAGMAIRRLDAARQVADSSKSANSPNVALAATRRRPSHWIRK